MLLNPGNFAIQITFWRGEMSFEKEVLCAQAYAMTLVISNCQTTVLKIFLVPRYILYLSLPWSIFWDAEPCSLHDRGTLSLLLLQAQPKQGTRRFEGGTVSSGNVFISLTSWEVVAVKLYLSMEVISTCKTLLTDLPVHQSSLFPGIDSHALSHSFRYRNTVRIY